MAGEGERVRCTSLTGLEEACRRFSSLYVVAKVTYAKKKEEPGKREEEGNHVIYKSRWSARNRAACW